MFIVKSIELSSHTKNAAGPRERGTQGRVVRWERRQKPYAHWLALYKPKIVVITFLTVVRVARSFKIAKTLCVCRVK